MIHHLYFKVASTGDALHLRCRLDTTQIWSDFVTETHEIVTQFDDSDNIDHCLELELQGKQHIHTTLDQHGNIKRDSMLIITDIRMDDIELDYLFYKNCVYLHDTNGTESVAPYDFWGNMGCNGTVTFCWRSPFYLWYLQEKNQ